MQTVRAATKNKAYGEKVMVWARFLIKNGPFLNYNHENSSYHTEL